MTQVPAALPDGPKEEIDLQIADPELDFERAKDMAKEKSRELRGETMLLSWKNSLTGEYYPTFDCGGSERPAWILLCRIQGSKPNHPHQWRRIHVYVS